MHGVTPHRYRIHNCDRCHGSGVLWTAIETGNHPERCPHCLPACPVCGDALDEHGDGCERHCCDGCGRTVQVTVYVGESTRYCLGCLAAELEQRGCLVGRAA